MTDIAVSPDQALDAQLRSGAPDLWLSTRLVADPARRSALTALYLVNVELARTAGAAKTSLAGEIRLAWWREEVEAMFGAPRALAHPALQALRGAPGLDRPSLETMIEARHAELDARPFADEAALVAYLDGVDGALMRAAAALLDAPGANLTHTGRAWGWARLLRERRGWQARARDWVPDAWGEASDAEIAAHGRHRALDALKAARGEAAALPVNAFPAAAYATLAAPYAKGRSLSELERRVRLTWASLWGKL